MTTQKETPVHPPACKERELDLLMRIGTLLTSGLNLDQVLQTVTDAATRLTGAQFGAFFYNVKNQEGESYLLYTLSGVSMEAFAKFPMPRNTAIFAMTFSGKGVLRSDDITVDPRYGMNAPFRGMPAGHLPVKSYLAVPVITRSGEILGGLFLGHAEKAKFDDDAETITVAIASYAAVAVDNARMYAAVERSEKEYRQLCDAIPHWIWTTKPDGHPDFCNRACLEYATGRSFLGWNHSCVRQWIQSLSVLCNS